MPTPVGLSIPKMLPITGTFLFPITLYYLYLSLSVSLTRDHVGVTIGSKSKETGEEPDSLLVARRCHANFAENVPFALLTGAVVEMNGGNRKFLTSSYAALLMFRILHVEFGLKVPGSRSLGRKFGHIGTLSFLGGMSGYAAYLVKGYWGL